MDYGLDKIQLQLNKRRNHQQLTSCTNSNNWIKNIGSNIFKIIFIMFSNYINPTFHNYISLKLYSNLIENLDIFIRYFNT